MGEEKRKLDIKKESFEKDPDNFVSIEDLVCAVRINDGKLETFVNIGKASNLATALGLVVTEVSFAIKHAQMLKRKEDSAGIIHPGGNGKRI